MSSATTVPKPEFRGRLARKLLVLCLLISTGPSLLMTSTGYWRARQVLRAQSFTLLGTVAQAQGRQLSTEVMTGQMLLSQSMQNERLLQGLRTALSNLDRTSPDFKNARQEVIGQLEEINQSRHIFDQFIVVQPDGIIHLASRQVWEGIQLPPQVNGQVNTKSSSLVIYDLQPIYINDLVILSASPFVDEQGGPSATLIGIIESPTIQGLVSHAAFSTSNQYFVTREGLFLEANPDPKSAEGFIPFTPSATQSSVIPSGLKNGSGVSEIDAMLSAYTWLPDLGTGWVTEVSRGSLFAGINTLLVFTVLLFLGTILVTGLIGWQVTRHLVQPLNQMVTSLDEFAEGDWNERLPYKRDDEIGLLAYTINEMADKLSGAYRRLENTVEASNAQVRASGEAAQIASTSANLDDLLNRIVKLVAGRFNLPYVSIYLVDPASRSATLQRVFGPPDIEDRVQGTRLLVDSRSLIGWVASFNKARIDRLAGGDFISTQRQDLLPGGEIEAGLPIAVGDQVLGVINIQSPQVEDIDDECLDNLENLAHQMASSLHSFYLLEAAQVDLQETNLLYQASHQIAQSDTYEQIFQIAVQALQQTPYASVLLLPEDQQVQVAFSVLPARHNLLAPLPKVVPIPPDMLLSRLQMLDPNLSSVRIVNSEEVRALPTEIASLARLMRSESLALIPVLRNSTLSALLVVGRPHLNARSRRLFTDSGLQPYVNLVELLTTAMEKIQALENMEKSLAELQSVGTLSQAISIETDLEVLYQVLHRQLIQLLGPVDFYVALYDPATQMIRIPYMMEEDTRLDVSPFPLGEGLTSILLRTRQPLIIVDNAESRALALGAKTTGAQAKSWLGVPLLLGSEIIGAMVVQDAHQEKRFTQDDLNLMTTLANQVAVGVRNASLLANTRRRAERERTLFDITSKIRRSVDMQSILQTTATELAQALKARRAHIEIKVEASAPVSAGTHGPNGDRPPGPSPQESSEYGD